MAEAMVVEEQPKVPKRFYCHMCNVEINIPNRDFTCPLCSNGFIEELPANAPELTAAGSSGSNIGLGGGPSGSGSAGQSDAGTSSGSSSSTSSGGGTSALGSSLLSVESLRNDIVSLLSMRNVPNLEITIEPNRRHTSVMHLGGPVGGAASGASIAGGRVRPAHLDRLDNVLYDFLQSLPLAGATAEIVTGSGSGSIGTGNSHMFFMGNPGDYAWGREGLDTIVTQMLNQMETSGPPPLSTQRINEIPNVKITAEHVERKLQCSVCWDDFKLDESVRKLPCSHLYHENCIVPWLNLHSTCPICRKSLANDDDNDDIDVDEDYVLLNRLMEERGGNSTNSSRAAVPSSNASSQTAAQSDTAAPGAGATASAPRNNVFTFDDDNMFLD